MIDTIPRPLAFFEPGCHSLLDAAASVYTSDSSDKMQPTSLHVPRRYHHHSHRLQELVAWYPASRAVQRTVRVVIQPPILTRHLDLRRDRGYDHYISTLSWSCAWSDSIQCTV